MVDAGKGLVELGGWMGGRGASGGENKQEGETVVKQQQALYCHASQVLKSAFYNFPSTIHHH
jgi:hypothetical protein